MFTFESATDLHNKFAEFYEAGKLACALCHDVTGFANVIDYVEEDFADDAVGHEAFATRQAHRAVADRGRDEEARSQPKLT